MRQLRRKHKKNEYGQRPGGSKNTIAMNNSVKINKNFTHAESVNLKDHTLLFQNLNLHP